MKLWLLKAREDLSDDDNPWEPWYDRIFEFVIRAETEEKARQLATEQRGYETMRFRDAWTNEKYSACEEVTVDGEPSVIIYHDKQA